MKGTRIYIVEDEPLIAMTIATALKKSGFYLCADPAPSISDARKDIESFKPDLVLIDIRLDGKEDGVVLANELEVLGTPYIYITSQTDPLTLARVKSTNPLTYLVKPFTESGLRSGVEIAWHNHIKSQVNNLVFHSEHTKYVVSQQDIVYLKAFDNYCYLFTKTNKYLIPKTLKFISDKLDTRLFAKCHRSYVVNINEINKIVGDKVYLRETEIPLSRSYKKELNARISGE